jgi:hypothetical protein
MADPTTPRPGEPQDIRCPHCTIQIPSDVSVCPYCFRSVFRERRERERPEDGPMELRQRLVPPGRFPALKRLWEEHGKWLKIAAPVLLAALALWGAYGFWSGLKVKVTPDTTFLIQAEKQKDGPHLLLKGKLTNRGEDVPDLSLRSIGVIAELRYRDGRTERRRVFPKSPYRGEGALMRGETGSFEIEVTKEVSAVTLHGEIVDLGEDRRFIPAGQGTRLPPTQKAK